MGVLLDTLVVRPILVPTFLVLLQGGGVGRLGQYLPLNREGTSPREEASLASSGTVHSEG